MATTSPTRIDDDLYAAAKAVGAKMSRSAAQQIAHWARVGRELEMSSAVSHRDIEKVLAGAADYDLLPANEQAVVRAEWSERVTAARTSLNFAREFTAAGEPYTELDSDGKIAHRVPAKPGAAHADR